MKHALLLLALAASALAQRSPEERKVKDWTDCRLKDFYPSSCVGIYHHYTVADGIAAFAGYTNYESYMAAKWKYLAEQGRTLYQNAKREADELRAEVKRLRESTATATYPPPVAAALPVYAPETFEPSAPDSFQHPANKTRQGANAGQPRHIYGDQRQPTSATSTRLGNTITTEISDGRTCTTTLLGGTATTECY